ncbi:MULTISPECIES: hypothetical protein [Sphingobium]|jgi:hypothetical protein|uniref:Uncharacterized protein n=1 Tax=Sphingobium yanoikuyae TaxID=13690 RepID=A0A084EIW9_SPHYA|nr:MULTISPECIES: hypothetical protein [Sphingobium]KEZ17911.1 hypothetical protein CP98_03086 [Sphingobium yanoikuyae]
MSDSEFEHVTTEAAVAIYASATGAFSAVLNEIRELSKKKPDATMSSSKVKVINKVLDDLLVILKDEPEGKYLERLEDADLPQVSDALLTMVQYNPALDAFKKRYLRYVKIGYDRKHLWITAERVAEWEADDEDASEEEDDL